RRRGGSMAAHGACAAVDDASGRVLKRRVAWRRFARIGINPIEKCTWMSVAPMPQKPQKSELGSSGLHQTVRGGEHVLIRRARSEDVPLYQDFLADVSAEDLRLRFFADIADLSAAEGRSSPISTGTTSFSLGSMKRRARCSGSCA